jgi:hypothetical protein
MSKLPSCKLCEESTAGIHEIATKKAAKTAHEIAVKEANQQEVYTFLDSYIMFFKRVYEHEYTRNCRIEYERKHYNIRKTANAQCDYHSAFDEERYKEIIKKAESEYADNKWPNPLTKAGV